MSHGPDARRRQLCLAALAAGLPGAAPAQGEPGQPPVVPPVVSPALPPTLPVMAADAEDLPSVDPSRLALVIGNSDYPGDFNLPSILTNARLLQQALRRIGFQVTQVPNAGPAQARQAVDNFVASALAAPADAVLFFYFSGHGLQLDTENLLVAAGVAPNAPADKLVAGCLALQRDVVQRLPRRDTGLTIAVVDACRSFDAGAAKKGLLGFNQVEAPPGCLITFSTGAGKYALAPLEAAQSTFYTAELVKGLQAAPDELSFSDLFKSVKIEVERTMRSFPAKLVRDLAQVPFIAENTRQTVAVAPRTRRRTAAPPVDRAAEDRDWASLQAAFWPPELRRLAQQFRERYPASSRAVAADVAAEGAKDAANILRRNDVRLYRNSFAPDAERGEPYNTDLGKAARGDKDAAARIGRQRFTSESSGAAVSLYEGWMQFAAELGNGIASYELALHFRRRNQPQPAARWEARARELGYNPPASLEHYRK